MSDTATIETEVGERSVTLADVMSWKPCYPESRLLMLAAGRERITAREALDLPIPAQDRLWLALREELVPAPVLHEFACRCAEGAKRGEASDAGLATTGAAARDAAWDAAWAAAWAAAAAGDAARDAAWAAAGAAQVEILRSLLAGCDAIEAAAAGKGAGR